MWSEWSCYHGLFKLSTGGRDFPKTNLEKAMSSTTGITAQLNIFSNPKVLFTVLVSFPSLPPVVVMFCCKIASEKCSAQYGVI